MKFYEVQDDYGDYMAVIWAKNIDEARETYHRDITDEKTLVPIEIDIDVLYDRMIEAVDTDRKHDYAVFGIMGRLQAIISSTVPVVVLTRGVD